MYRLNVRCDDLWVELVVGFAQIRDDSRSVCPRCDCVLVPCVCSRLPPVFLNHVGAY